MLNDTSIESTHFGCQLIGATFREQFSRVGLRLVGAFSKRFDLEEIRGLEGEFDFVVVNGEGTLHDGKNANLIDIAARYPAALVNTVYQRNPPRDALAAFKLVSARESRSAAEIQGQGVNCVVVPDFLFASSQVRAAATRLRVQRAMGRASIARELGRTDSVTSRIVRVGPLRIPLTSGRRPFGGTPAAHLDYFAGSAKLAVGRFHAACAAAALGVPFASWDSNTWKTEAMMDDMGASEWHFRSEREAVVAAHRATIPASMAEWVQLAPERIEALFDSLASIASTYARKM